MFEQPFPPLCPICRYSLEWQHSEPSRLDSGRTAPYCKYCGWFGTSEEATEAGRSRIYSVAALSVFSFIIWVVVGSAVVAERAPWWALLLVGPPSLFPVFWFNYGENIRLQKEFYQVMIRESRNKRR